MLALFSFPECINRVVCLLFSIVIDGHSKDSAPFPPTLHKHSANDRHSYICILGSRIVINLVIKSQVFIFFQMNADPGAIFMTSL
jgi:hypothetical protein